MELEKLFSVQKDMNKLKSLYQEMAAHESFNPYKKNIASDMPKGAGRKSFGEWYIEEKERIDREVEYYKEKLQVDRRELDEYISTAPFPECDIIQYRVINGMNWEKIGDLIGMDRRTASRIFYRYVNLPTMPIRK
ncbi:hypothetical protein [[Clostridium] symbiosum]|uniref:hypothetical protein n=1 Tax=Clostridium symbiosum TaxID=1512 RepID=UPI00214AEC58|nr:hypothetical protein [[Clostridium] symbiosum]MCR1941243.1 hypothetical protein [[Clostridium] symbiosum]